MSAVGLFNHANIPNIPGRDDFKGASWHSSKWNHNVPIAGKTVAVIGCGASAVQFIPKIAPQVGKLVLYQRSPQYVMPKAIFPGASEFDMWLQKRKWLRGLARLKVYLMFERFILRRRIFPDARLKGEAAFRALLERKVKDPELRKKLTPNYPMGCKRQLVSDHWYEALTRPNVEVVIEPISRIDADRHRDRRQQASQFRRHRLRHRLHADDLSHADAISRGWAAATSTKRGATEQKPISASR